MTVGEAKESLLLSQQDSCEKGCPPFSPGLGAVGHLGLKKGNASPEGSSILSGKTRILLSVCASLLLVGAVYSGVKSLPELSTSLEIEEVKSCQGCDGIIREVEPSHWEALLPPGSTSNHASFVEQAGEGTMVMTWFGGSREGKSGVSIYVSRLAHGVAGNLTDAQWSEPLMVSSRDGYSNQNPVLHYDGSTGRLHLFHTQQEPTGPGKGPMTMETTATLWHLTSDDGGVTWTEPELFIDIPGVYDRNRIIKDPKNMGWLLPLYHVPGSSSTQYSTMVLLAPETLQPIGEFVVWDSFYLVQPSVVSLEGEEMVVFFRDRRKTNIYSARSSDGGRTWSKPQPTDLPNNNSGIHAIRMRKSGNIVIVFNNCRSGPRTPMSIAMSEDDGVTWTWLRNLDDESEGANSKVELSYPTVMETSDEMIHISYTFNRDTIKHVIVTEEWIKAGKRDLSGTKEQLTV